MIALSCALTAYEAVDRLLHPQEITHLWAVAMAAVIGFAGNETVARYRVRVGTRIGSAALVADGLHTRTDGFTSLAVLVGAGGAALGWNWADPVVGLLITATILGILRSAVRQVGARLMDAVDPQLVDQAQASISSVPGVPRSPRAAHPLDRPHAPGRGRRHRGFHSVRQRSARARASR